MSYGIKIKNINAEILIDGDYVNYKLDNYGTIGLVPTGVIPVDNKINPPLAIIRPTLSGEAVSLVDFERSAGGVYTSVRLSSAFNATGYTDWRLYTADGDISAGSNYGFKVKNQNGKIVYDSNFSYFKINNVVSFTPPTAWNGYVDISHTGIADPYYIITPGGRKIAQIEKIQQVPDLYGYFACVLGIQKLSSTSIRIKWVPVRAFASTTYPVFDWRPTNKLIICIP